MSTFFSKKSNRRRKRKRKMWKQCQLYCIYVIEISEFLTPKQNSEITMVKFSICPNLHWILCDLKQVRERMKKGNVWLGRLISHSVFEVVERLIQKSEIHQIFEFYSKMHKENGKPSLFSVCVWLKQSICNPHKERTLLACFNIN